MYNKPLSVEEIQWEIEQSRRYESASVTVALEGGGELINGHVYIKPMTIEPGLFISSGISVSNVTDQELLLRHILRCPEGDDLAQHARAVRVMADSLVKLVGQ